MPLQWVVPLNSRSPVDQHGGVQMDFAVGRSHVMQQLIELIHCSRADMQTRVLSHGAMRTLAQVPGGILSSHFGCPCGNMDIWKYAYRGPDINTDSSAQVIAGWMDVASLSLSLSPLSLSLSLPQLAQTSNAYHSIERSGSPQIYGKFSPQTLIFRSVCQWHTLCAGHS